MIPYNKEVEAVFEKAVELRAKFRNGFVTPEHILLALFQKEKFVKAIESACDVNQIIKELTEYLVEMATEENLIELDDSDIVSFSSQAEELLETIDTNAECAHQKTIDPSHVINGIYQLTDSNASYILQKNLTTNYGNFLSLVVSAYRKKSVVTENTNSTFTEQEAATDSTSWKSLIVCINDHVKDHNPLIGRGNELDRTIQILCRKDKNNPLHIGEPGVGKTAIVYGLAKLINEGKVPDRLKDYKIYELNLGNLVAGTQFRGDFENRIKQIMEGACKQGKVIIYIDEIHNLVGAGRTGGDSLDAGNMLKTYLEGGEIRFIGSTTYDEYNKYFSKDKALVRRFQQVDIAEPSIAEAIQIVSQLKNIYESYHNVKYEQEAIEYAVTASAEYITNRFLPDKAIDLIDEAGACAEIQKEETSSIPVIRKEEITQLLYKVCKIDAKALKTEDNNSVQTLETDILAKIYGQDKAVQQIVETIQMAKAGLSDDSKPMASLLFVGPTGVGKTELCKVLAQTLGISLIRFDMSEFAEKHTVAKLIGSPAGYIGYEEGGLLTDAIIKTPNCVLLLDEIEKAHPDIFDILLQVMDYARLTDNKGKKADFRHVILIMTSNAGAQYAHLSNIGFGTKVTAGNAMLTQVKKTFKPEFINRLNDIVVFNDMDSTMASKILEKKLAELNDKLSRKNITLTLSKEARNFLLQKGYSKEYGAREMDRTLRTHLTTLLTKEILFGTLKDGGEITAVVEDNHLKLIR